MAGTSCKRAGSLEYLGTAVLILSMHWQHPQDGDAGCGYFVITRGHLGGKAARGGKMVSELPGRWGWDRPDVIHLKKIIKISLTI